MEPSLFGKFLVECRIERSCVLLVGTDLSVQEISNSVGFEDPFYFSRVFKEFKGVSPRQYANRMREEHAKKACGEDERD